MLRMPELPPELIESLSILDPEVSGRIKDALLPVASELGPRELAVLDRLAKGIAGGSSSSELNAFGRLLPVTVSRAVGPAIEPVKA